MQAILLPVKILPMMGSGIKLMEQAQAIHMRPPIVHFLYLKEEVQTMLFNLILMEGVVSVLLPSVLVQEEILA